MSEERKKQLRQAMMFATGGIVIVASGGYVLYMIAPPVIGVASWAAAQSWGPPLVHIENFYNAETISNTLDLLAFILVTPNFLGEERWDSMLRPLITIGAKYLSVASKEFLGIPIYLLLIGASWIILYASSYVIPQPFVKYVALLLLAIQLPFVVAASLGMFFMLLGIGLSFYAGVAMFVAARGIMIVHGVLEAATP